MYVYVQRFLHISPFDISMSSGKNNVYAVCKSKKKYFSTTINGVSLWNSLHNFVKLSSTLRIKKEQKFFMLIC